MTGSNFSVDLWSSFVKNPCLKDERIQFCFVSLASSARLACVAQVSVTSRNFFCSLLVKSKSVCLCPEDM